MVRRPAVSSVVVVSAHRVPALPGDVQDEGCDEQADDGIGNRGAERNGARAQDHAGADDRVAAGVVAVGDQRRAVQAAAAAEPDPGGDCVADDPNEPGEREGEQVRRREGVDDYSHKYRK